MGFSQSKCKSVLTPKIQICSKFVKNLTYDMSYSSGNPCPKSWETTSRSNLCEFESIYTDSSDILEFGLNFTCCLFVLKDDFTPEPERIKWKQQNNWMKNKINLVETHIENDQQHLFT